MRYEIIFSPEAVEDLRRLPAHFRSAVKEAIERHLCYEPAMTGKSRIKRLRGLSRPQYHLRIEDIRVFYDVIEGTIEILAIVPKAEASQ